MSARDPVTGEPFVPRPVQLPRAQALEILLRQTRRKFLTSLSGSVGSLALGLLLGPRLLASPAPGAPAARGRWSGVQNPPTFVPRARRIIHLCMAGGPSQFETLDHKPTLAALNGQPMPKSVTDGQPIAQLQGKALHVLGPQAAFSRCGQSGLEIADILPQIQGVADELCIVRSMVTEQINHDPAHTYFNTGSRVQGFPSIGSWLLYGLGSANDNLPGFVVLTSEGGGQAQPISARQWSSGFLPSQFQGVKLNATGEPVYYVQSPDGVDNPCQSEVLAAVAQLNQEHARAVDDPEIAERIAQYELAFRMQMAVPELTDFSGESPETLALYGCRPGDGTFASNCLLARRLAERGVRFIQLYHRGWDHHGGIHAGVRRTAGLVDRATAALIRDLKRRGLLEDTLIVWGGEFGRTPMAQGDGRDHHIKGYSLFLCGGGAKAGMAYGGTDEFGYHAVENPVHVRDLHATMLYLLGLDHARLTFRHQGLDAKLTGVEPARILHPLLA